MKTNTNVVKTMVMLLVTMFLSCSNDDGQGKQNEILQVTPQELGYAATGGYKVLNIAIGATTEWEISTTADWLSFSVASGIGSKSINVQATVNEAAEARATTITINSADESIEIPVNQQAGEEIGEETGTETTIPDDPSEMSTYTAVELAAQMGVGWNVGNSLDAVGGETAWGNPAISKELIDAVKAAGFDAVRIPVAWSQFSDNDNFVISESWMDRVEEVVNYVVENDMYAIVNIHWDGGWMQPTYDQQEYVNARLATMWQQIAVNFRDYDYHLLFAGTNEVMVEGDYGEPTEEYYTVQNSFNETFVNTVRATGGRNAYRYLVVQGFNTNIDYTVNFATIPEDTAANRLMMEIHYYDPYNFTLNEGNDDIWQWGKDATNADATETWANESYADAQFDKMKTNFIDNGISVILGEYGAIARTDIAAHAAFREYYISYVTQSAVNHGLVPFYWDNGFGGNHGMGLFDRNTGEQIYPEIISRIVNSTE